MAAFGTDTWNDMDETSSAMESADRENAEFGEIDSQNRSLSGRGWEDVQREQMQRDNSQTVSYNQRRFDGFRMLGERFRNEEAEMNQRKAIAGSAMLMSAFENGGQSDPRLARAFSEEMGSPILGVKFISGESGPMAGLNGHMAVLGMRQGPDGKSRVGIVGAIDPENQMRMLQRSMTGDRTLPLQRKLYSVLSRSLTEDQLLQRGIQNPDGPYATGGVGGKNVARLFGRTGPREGRISVFSTADGLSRTWDPNGDRQWHVDSDEMAVANAARRQDPNHESNWKVVRSGEAYGGTVYHNSRTGEEITVGKGDTLRGVLARGTEKVQAAQVAQGGKGELERIRLKLKEYGINIDAQLKERGLALKEQALANKGNAASGDGTEWNDKRHKAIVDERDKLVERQRIEGKDFKDQARLDELNNIINSNLGLGQNKNGQAAVAPGADAIRKVYGNATQGGHKTQEQRLAEGTANTVAEAERFGFGRNKDEDDKSYAARYYRAKKSTLAAAKRDGFAQNEGESEFDFLNRYLDQKEGGDGGENQAESPAAEGGSARRDLNGGEKKPGGKNPENKSVYETKYGFSKDVIDEFKRLNPDADISKDDVDIAAQMANLARIDVGGDSVKKYTEVKKEEKAAESRERQAVGDVAREDIRTRYDNYIKNLPDIVKRDAVRQGKDYAWIKKEIASRKKKAENEFKMAQPRYDISGNPHPSNYEPNDF